MFVADTRIKMMSSFVQNVKNKLKLPPPGEVNKQKKRKAKKKPDEETEMKPGVVYIGHIPRGFFEKQMTAYFSQFGDILRFRLARSSRTGGSKGFAFIEFESEEVAKIVADTMNNYLFFEKLLKCEFVPSDKVHPKAFKGWSQGMPLRWQVNKMRHNSPRSNIKLQQSHKRRFQRLKKLRSSLKESGITLKINKFKPNKSQ